MPSMAGKLQKFEFEYRIFISFGLVGLVCFLAFSVFSRLPANAVLVGRLLRAPGLSDPRWGYLAAAAFMAVASFVRIWAGSWLTSERMMSFKVKSDVLCLGGPYRLVRNPIYFADLIAFSGFALSLSPVGLLLPVLLFGHYTQLIRFEETSLAGEIGPRYDRYRRQVPSLIPGLSGLKDLAQNRGELSFTRDGLRHNGLYLLFIPGYLAAALTGRILWAVVLGLPAVLDWAVIHTLIGTKRPAAAPPKPRKVFRGVLYANCWEDPRTDRTALRIGPEDTVFCVTSGGCNALAFLLDNPRKVIACDLNPGQNFLLELKAAALRRLDHADMLAFLGVRPSSSRLETYGRLRADLSPGAAGFWDALRAGLKTGILHCGRYEGYMRLLRKVLVRPLGGRRLVEKLYAAGDRTARARLFREEWDGLWWKLLTRVMLSRRLNEMLFDKAFFAHLEDDFSFGRHFAAKAERALVGLPLGENPYISYILRGGFRDGDAIPLYLRSENQAVIRGRLDRLEIVTGGCLDVFSRLPDRSISKFNFSNIFEWMSPADFEAHLREAVRLAKDGAVLVYRNLLVPRRRPPSLADRLVPLADLASSLLEEDLSFIYNGYVVEVVRKEPPA